MDWTYITIQKQRQKYKNVCCSRCCDLQQPIRNKLESWIEICKKMKNYGLDCVHPKIKSNRPNQSLNWNCLLTQFQSHLERNTKKYFMQNWKWSINRNINIKPNWIRLLPPQYKTQNQSKLDWCVIQKNIKQTKRSMSKLLDHAVSISLGERHKTIAMSSLTLWIKKNQTSIFYDPKKVIYSLERILSSMTNTQHCQHFGCTGWQLNNTHHKDNKILTSMVSTMCHRSSFCRTRTAKTILLPSNGITTWLAND